MLCQKMAVAALGISFSQKLWEQRVALSYWPSFFFFFNQKENHAHSSTKWDYMSIPSLKAAWKRVNYFQPLWYKVSSAGKVKRRKRWLQGGQPASSVYHKHPVYTVQWRLDQVRSHAASFSLVSRIK